MTFTKYALVLLLPCVPLTAQAHYYGRHWEPQPVCDHAETASTVLHREIVAVTSRCQLLPLALVRAPWRDQTVDAWTGGYQRTVLMDTVYRLDHFDRCTGTFLWSETKEGTVPETLSFSVDNPNLDPNLPSYAANAPLTRKEAEAALAKPRAACQRVHAAGIEPPAR